MLKAPVEGFVKTRLAREIGFPAATDAYRRLVEHQLREIPRGWRTHICLAPADAEPAMREWLGDAHDYSAQSNGDLGARLSAAMLAHFTRNFAPLVFIGGDCPYLSEGTFRQVAKLLNYDAVIVPADDGGYCLLALRSTQPELFREIAWSTASVLQETRDRLRGAGLKWRELDAVEDVDDAASWLRAVAAFPHLESSK